MKISLPRISDVFDAGQLRELVRRLETAFSNVVEDQRRGAITVTADYELTRVDSLVLVEPSGGGSVTISVPAVADWMVTQKWEWEVKLNSTGELIVAPVSGTIDGYTGVSTTSVGTALALRATDDGWKIV